MGLMISVSFCVIIHRASTDNNPVSRCLEYYYHKDHHQYKKDQRAEPVSARLQRIQVPGELVDLLIGKGVDPRQSLLRGEPQVPEPLLDLRCFERLLNADQVGLSHR